MKEILYSATVLLVIFSLLFNRSISTLIIIACAVVILIIYMTKFKVKFHETFTTTSSMVSADIYVNEQFKEILPDDVKQNLVYYVSSFDKTYIDFANSGLINHMNGSLGALLEADLKNFPYDYFHQYNGIRINNKIECASAKLTLESFNQFSIFWYMKINRTTDLISGSSPKIFSILKFEHSNVENSDGFALMNVTLEFEGGNKLNPSIVIRILNAIPSINGKEAKYSFTMDDYLSNKVFMDDKYHLFTLVKNSGQLFFYVDNHLLINCDDEMCFNKDQYTLYPRGSTEIGINEGSLITINDNGDNPNLILYLNAFGVYRNKALSSQDVGKLLAYFQNIKIQLSPDYITILNENKLLSEELSRYTRECPFYDSNVCNSRECYGITDWADMDTLTANKECFKKITDYCNTLSNLENDPVCRYLKRDNIFKMASAIDSNLFMYDPNNRSNLDIRVHSNVLHKLEQLGLKNIYLDKSYRDMNGKYSGEMERLINDLLQTNQTVDLNTIEALYDTNNTNTRITNDIDYDNLYNNASFSNDNSYIDMYNSLLAQQSNNTTITQVSLSNTSNTTPSSTEILDDNIIDLNYNNMKNKGIYDNILRSHRNNILEQETTDNGSFFRNLIRWF